uniref:Uncharacterized protein n=1 Tax=Dulem virus 29 TaxID=3145747 RepID=A0AAU8B1K9_9CAUD
MDGYKIYNLEEFDKLSVPQIYVNPNLEGIGEVEICIFKGMYYGVVFNGEVLTPGVNGQNPYVGKNGAAYIDNENNLWVGVKDES